MVRYSVLAEQNHSRFFNTYHDLRIQMLTISQSGVHSQHPHEGRCELKWPKRTIQFVGKAGALDFRESRLREMCWEVPNNVTTTPKVCSRAHYTSPTFFIDKDFSEICHDFRGEFSSLPRFEPASTLALPPASPPGVSGRQVHSCLRAWKSVVYEKMSRD